MQSVRSLAARWAGLVLLAAGPLLLPVAGRGNILYRNYELRTDGGQDILCAPYVVQKHDWVYKILKLRGEIAQEDFPAFLDIFRRINPQIHDINTIRPGERILIPLRRVQREQLPVDPAGIVTIPFVHHLGRRPAPDEPQRAYRVRPGDCVSKLLAMTYGDYGSQGYREAEALFRRLNPHLTDLDRIYVGQRLILPAPPAGAFAREDTVPPASEVRPDSSGAPAEEPPALSGLARTARLLQATLKDRGAYFFPRPDGPDAALDLSRTPLMTLPDGTRLLFAGEDGPADDDLAAARRHWPDLAVVPTPADAGPTALIDGLMGALSGRVAATPLRFDDGGVQVTVRARWMLRLSGADVSPVRHLCVTPIASPTERTPAPVVRYLEAHGIRLREIEPPRRPGAPPIAMPIPRTAPPPRELSAIGVRRFVSDLLEATGYEYTPNARITFPYAGLQIEATSNVVHTPEGAPLFIDFGDLYGEAFDAIRRTGFRIIRLERRMPPGKLVQTLLEALDADCEKDPKLLAARRPATFNTEIVLPGLLVAPAQEDGSRRLITTAALDERIELFLAQRRVQVLRYRQGTGPLAARPPS